jgi:hypothetical protein
VPAPRTAAPCDARPGRGPSVDPLRAPRLPVMPGLVVGLLVTRSAHRGSL